MEMTAKRKAILAAKRVQLQRSPSHISRARWEKAVGLPTGTIKLVEKADYVSEAVWARIFDI